MRLKWRCMSTCFTGMMTLISRMITQLCRHNLSCMKVSVVAHHASLCKALVITLHVNMFYRYDDINKSHDNTIMSTQFIMHEGVSSSPPCILMRSFSYILVTPSFWIGFSQQRWRCLQYQKIRGYFVQDILLVVDNVSLLQN